MKLSWEDVQREAAAAGFRAEPMEKALRLLEVLEALRSHPFLKERIVLKGGTALNLFFFDAPRLSVDIDLNYIGSADRETMLEERPKIEQAVQAVCGRLGIRIHRVPEEHAGGKWRLSYDGTSGRRGTLELDMSFMYRIPLWPLELRDSRPLGAFSVTRIPVLDVHELAGGKLSALFSRNTCRDLFDAHYLFRNIGFDPARLRLGFVVYGGASRRDWREVKIEEIRADPGDVGQQLVPMLRNDLAPGGAEIESWVRKLIDECRGFLGTLLPFKPQELEFLARLNEQGEIDPALLTDDAAMQETLRRHPGLLWKAQNVRQYKRRGGRK
ncbi:MAG: nucleotidyl transferase AbiEii/AbiGii toxin family protein [Candidatus Aminicenantales bacterium]